MFDLRFYDLIILNPWWKAGQQDPQPLDWQGLTLSLSEVFKVTVVFVVNI